VLTSPEKQIGILAVQLAKINGHFYFPVRPILPWVNKIYLLVYACRFNSDCLFFSFVLFLFEGVELSV